MYRAQSNSLIIFLIRDYLLGRKINKIRKDLLAATFDIRPGSSYSSLHRLLSDTERSETRRNGRWFDLKNKLCWHINFWEVIPLYMAITLFLKLFIKGKCMLTFRDIRMIDWSKTNAHFYIPERFNLKYKQENELGWRKKWEEGKTVFEREKRNENFIECHSSHNTCYFAKVGNLHIEYHFENKYATYILEIEGDKRCSCNDCKEDIPGSFVVKENWYYKKKKSRSLLLPQIIRLATREAPLSYYFVTLPPIIQILVDWSPFLRDRILVLAQHFLTLVRSDGSKVELDYTAEFQDLKNDFNYHIIESMRILEGVDIATADFNYGIYAYKDYINNKYYDHWGYVEHNRPDVVRVDETDEFTAKDSLGSLLLKNGFSKRALSQVHIIRRVNHPAGNYIAYV